MKKTILYALLTLTLLCLGTVLMTGCSDDEIKQPISVPGGDDSTGDRLDDSKFNIYYKGQYACAFVIPDSATDIEQTVANKLKATLSSRTGNMQLELVKESQLSDQYTHLFLIGRTSFSESQAVYSSLGKRSASISVSGTRLVFAFDNVTSGDTVIKTLMGALSEGGLSANEIRLPLDFTASYTALPNADELPAYSSTQTLTDCGNGSNMISSNTTLQAFLSYCLQLETMGFKKTVVREQSGNHFYSFEGENDYVYAYFSAYNSQARVVSGPLESFAAQDYSNGEPQTVSPYIASIPQPDNGQGYVFRLPDGRFIVHDGGYVGDDRVYSTLKQLQPEGKIVIAAYFISHPHSDHYPAFIDFIKEHRKDADIVLERVMLNMGANNSFIVKTDDRDENCSGDVAKIRSALSSYIPNVPVIQVHTGQLIDFGGATVEVLYTMEDILPRPLPNVNDSSLAIRISMKGHKILVLADTCYDSGPIMTEMWGDHLRSDILQVAHHGQWPSEKELYHCIKAEVILIPAVREKLAEYLLIKEGTSTAKVFIEYAKDVYISGDALEIINLPYTILNNKRAVLIALNPDLADSIP